MCTQGDSTTTLNKKPCALSLDQCLHNITHSLLLVQNSYSISQNQSDEHTSLVRVIALRIVQFDYLTCHHNSRDTRIFDYLIFVAICPRPWSKSFYGCSSTHEMHPIGGHFHLGNTLYSVTVGWIISHSQTTRLSAVVRRARWFLRGMRKWDNIQGDNINGNMKEQNIICIRIYLRYFFGDLCPQTQHNSKL